MDIDLRHTCFVDVTPIMDSIMRVYGYGGSEKAKVLVNSILDAAALQHGTFELMAADVDNAQAAHYDLDGDGEREPYILYSEAYLNELESNARTKWKVTFVFAHEIAHLVNSHVLGSVINRPSAELNADRWAGWVLHLMGASLTEACEWVEACSEVGDLWHPRRKARKEAVIVGWNQLRISSATEPVRGNKDVGQDDQSIEPSRPLSECERDRTGTLCFMNHTKRRLMVGMTVNGKGAQITVEPNGAVGYFRDKPVGEYKVATTWFHPETGRWVNGEHVIVAIHACETTIHNFNAK